MWKVSNMYTNHNYNWYEYSVFCLYKCYFKEMLFQKKIIRIRSSKGIQNNIMETE